MDANETRDALRLLTDLLPSVAERTSALLAEETAAKAGGGGLPPALRGAPGRSRGPDGPRGGRAAGPARAGVLRGRPPRALGGPDAGPERPRARVRGEGRPPAGAVRARAGAARGRAARRLQRAAARSASSTGASAWARRGPRWRRAATSLLRAWDQTGRGAADLQGVVEASRAALGHDLERVGADLERAAGHDRARRRGDAARPRRLRQRVRVAARSRARVDPAGRRDPAGRHARAHVGAAGPAGALHRRRGPGAAPGWRSRRAKPARTPRTRAGRWSRCSTTWRRGCRSSGTRWSRSARPRTWSASPSRRGT